jgi:hypothetical protein
VQVFAAQVCASAGLTPLVSISAKNIKKNFRIIGRMPFLPMSK